MTMVVDNPSVGAKAPKDTPTLQMPALSSTDIAIMALVERFSGFSADTARTMIDGIVKQACQAADQPDGTIDRVASRFELQSRAHALYEAAMPHGSTAETNDMQGLIETAVSDRVGFPTTLGHFQTSEYDITRCHKVTVVHKTVKVSS